MSDTVEKLAKEIHQVAVDHGWWEDDPNLPEKAMMVVTELAEWIQCRRDYSATRFVPDKHLPLFSDHIVEMADVLIRVLDLAAAVYDPAEFANVVRAKVEFNKKRPYRHGGKRF